MSSRRTKELVCSLFRIAVCTSSKEAQWGLKNNKEARGLRRMKNSALCRPLLYTRFLSWWKRLCVLGLQLALKCVCLHGRSGWAPLAASFSGSKASSPTLKPQAPHTYRYVYLYICLFMRHIRMRRNVQLYTCVSQRCSGWSCRLCTFFECAMNCAPWGSSTTACYTTPHVLPNPERAETVDSQLVGLIYAAAGATHLMHTYACVFVNHRM